MSGGGAYEADGAYAAKVREEVAFYRAVENVHDLPLIYHYWSNRYVLPKLREVAGVDTITEFFAGPVVALCRARSPSRPVRVVSLGSGNGELELQIAQSVLGSGHRNVRFTCLELNPDMQHRARTAAADADVDELFEFVEADLNSWVASEPCDVYMANHSLHHVVDLEHLFAQVSATLRDDGVFVVNDMIGRNGHQRWPEALELLQRIWATMPDRYRYNHLLARHEPAYINHDCSTEGFEGIRAQDILPLLLADYHPELFLAFANVVDVFVDRCFGHNFDPESAQDLEFIDRVAQLDDLAIDLGVVKPTHLIATFRARPTEARFVRHWSPAHCLRRPDLGHPAPEGGHSGGGQPAALIGARLTIEGPARQLETPEGLWPDGWAGPMLRTRLRLGADVASLALVGRAPLGLSPGLQLTLVIDSQEMGTSAVLDGHFDARFPVALASGSEPELAVVASASRQPSTDGISTDTRHLAYLLDEVRLEPAAPGSSVRSGSRSTAVEQSTIFGGLAAGHRQHDQGDVTTSPASQHSALCRIGLWGTFDVESFGDLLLARILRGELRRRLPASEVTVFAPYGHEHPTRLDGGESPEPLGPWSADRVADLSTRLDCVIVTGETLSRWRDASLVDAYGVAEEEVATRAPARFLVGGLGDLEDRCPVLWAGVGLPVDATDDEAVALRKALAGRPYVAVWDEVSKHRLEEAGVDNEISVVPPATLLAPRHFPGSLLAKRLEYLKVMGWYPRDRPALVVQGDGTLVLQAGQIAAGLERIAAAHGSLAIVTAQTDPWRGDGEFADALAGALHERPYRLPVVGLEDLTAVFSDAWGVVGSSPAARTVAASYGRPCAGFDDPAGVDAALAAPRAGPELAVLQEQVDASIDAMAAIARQAAAARPGLGEEAEAADIEGLQTTLAALRRANRAQARQMVDERLMFADRVSEAEALIAAHAGVVAAQEAVIADQRRALEDQQRTLAQVHTSLQSQTAELERARTVFEQLAGYTAGLEARVEGAERARAAADHELAALRATRTFRWTRLARTALAGFRRLTR